ncbi:MAG TPA: alkaline phosphatase family protein [Kofleriaceae bacterium]|nr:alkaline phosphatase family protein [Kofleriaceae bacterium]
MRGSRRNRSDLTRRRVLAGLGAGAAAGLIGCGGDPSDAGPDGGPDPSPDGPGVNACTATSPMTPAELLAHVESIVVLCMENRSFDHYLGALRLAEGRMDVDGLAGGESNPNRAGTPVAVHPLDDYTPEDPPHSWDACHAQWNNGANDGFVREHAGASEADVMGYHVRSQLPVTYALADAGVVCNRWFSACLGPTWPNRFYLHGATSKGRQSNAPVLGFTSIWSRLADKGVDGCTNYYSDVAWATGGYGKLVGLAGIERFFEDAGAGNLPPFSIIDPQFFGGGANDDHPDHDIRMGQALIGSVAAALAQSPQWKRTLFVLTYDEHGGFYDHVPPPETLDGDAAFRRLGFRVPSIVLGPTVRRGCAVDDVFEHSSVVATATRRFGLEPLNARADAVNDVSPCIDPRRIDDPLPPPTVPAVSISLSALARRQELARRGPPSHPELAAAIDARRLPPALDRRGDADALTRRFLRWGERLGAVTITD